MRYFLIKVDPIYTSAPDVRDFNRHLDKKHLTKEEHYKIKNRFLITVEPQNKTIFTDVCVTPSFMVTGKLKSVIDLYIPKTVYKEVVLLDQKNSKVETYYLPILPQVDCLTIESELLPNNLGVKKIVLDLEKANNYSLFRIAHLINDYFIVRLDMAESILRRGAIGVHLEEVSIRREK
ncbi:MAG: hypothetical protein R3Y24_02730 [Eubacteriales bacterium]